MSHKHSAVAQADPAHHTAEALGQPARHRWVTYTAAGLLLLGLGIWAVLAFAAHSEARSTDLANEKASELTIAMTEAGFTPPTHEQIVQLFGDDGGAVCANPGSALVYGLAKFSLTNAASSPGQRPVLAPDRVLDGERLILQTYCPDKLGDLTELENTLQFTTD